MEKKVIQNQRPSDEARFEKVNPTYSTKPKLDVSEFPQFDQSSPKRDFNKSLEEELNLTFTQSSVDPSSLFDDGYELQDQSIIPNENLDGTFLPEENQIEFFVYDIDKNLLSSEYKFEDWNITTNTSTKTLTSTDTVQLYPDKNLYFTNNNGVLKSLQLDRSSQQLAFSVYTVDKYSTKQLFKNITKTIINDNEYIVAQSLDNNSMYLIESLDDGDIFRKVKLDFEYTDKIFGLNDRLIMGNKVYTVGDNNYKLAELIMNPPALNGNDILMDNNSSIKDVIIKLENEDRLAVEGVRINNKPLSNLPSTVEDLFNIYRYRTSFKVKNGFSIQIQTNENNKTCELSIVQMLVNPIKDN